MDYLRQLNAFDNWLEYNDLDITAQAMWYKLMSIANKSGWQVELSIANTKLMAKMQVDKKTVINCRNRLIQAGLIEYKSRGTKKAGVYIVKVLYKGNDSTNEQSNDWTNEGTNEGLMTPPYINNTKQNNNISPTTPKMAKSAELESDFEKLWNLYPRKERKADAFKAYKKAIKAGTTNKEIQNGIVAYARSVANTGKQYIAQGGTWFNQQRWQDVVDESVHHTQGFQDNYDEVMKAYEQ